jgi:hypothetical protein
MHILMIMIFGVLGGFIGARIAEKLERWDWDRRTNGRGPGPCSKNECTNFLGGPK